MNIWKLIRLRVRRIWRTYTANSEESSQIVFATLPPLQKSRRPARPIAAPAVNGTARPVAGWCKNVLQCVSDTMTLNSFGKYASDLPNLKLGKPDSYFVLSQSIHLTCAEMPRRRVRCTLRASPRCWWWCHETARAVWCEEVKGINSATSKCMCHAVYDPDNDHYDQCKCAGPC